MRLRGAAGSLIIALGAMTSSGCDDDGHIPIYEIDVADRTSETARDRSPAPHVLAPLLALTDEPGRVIYDPPTYLGRDTTRTSGDTTGPSRR